MVALTGQINQMAIVFDLSGKYGMVIKMDFSSIFSNMLECPPVEESTCGSVWERIEVA